MDEWPEFSFHCHRQGWETGFNYLLKDRIGLRRVPVHGLSSCLNVLFNDEWLLPSLIGNVFGHFSCLKNLSLWEGRLILWGPQMRNLFWTCFQMQHSFLKGKRKRIVPVFHPLPFAPKKMGVVFVISPLVLWWDLWKLPKTLKQNKIIHPKS